MNAFSVPIHGQIHHINFADRPRLTLSDPDHLECAILLLQNIAAKQAQMATRLLPAQFIPTAGMSVMVMLVWNEGARVRELESRMVSETQLRWVFNEVSLYSEVKLANLFHMYPPPECGVFRACGSPRWRRMKPLKGRSTRSTMTS